MSRSFPQFLAKFLCVAPGVCRALARVNKCYLTREKEDTV
jgi:hypothetical protein